MVPDDTANRGTADRSSADGTTSLPRRAFLASGVATALGSGCITKSQSLADRTSPDQPSLSIKTVPADDDARATKIARYLSENLSAVGVDASVVLLSREELYRDVLLNQSFDLYVARHPHVEDPDFLRSLLHSRFGGEHGWQNPFGYTNLELDERLEAQRTETGERRTRTLREVERIVARDQPFTVVAFPEEIRTVRADRVAPSRPNAERSALRYLAMESTETADSDDSTLRATLGDARATKNLNPLAIEFRNGSSVTNLLYDSLGRWVDGRVRPWLAAEWEWHEGAGDAGPRATVTLRDDVEWHDGTALTVGDVTFTYRFLRDTSLGTGQNPVPAPNYLSETSLVDSVWAGVDGRLEIQFRPVSRRVATRAFTVPVLPEHVWASRSKQATIAGIDTSVDVTEALIWNNLNPVGSGPLRFERTKNKESLVLRRFDDHFLHRTGASEEFGRYAGGLDFERLAFVVVPSNQAAVELVAEGRASFTGTPLAQSDVPRIGQLEPLSLRVGRPNSFYHVGYNAQIPPTSNVRVRRAIARLLDKAYVVDRFFGGYADPAASPLARSDVHSSTLRWTGTDPSTPFVGTDGRLDVDRARDLFREAGFRYSDDGKLLIR
jgi:peptide/nickel transport system substrate-binding protein